MTTKRSSRWQPGESGNRRGRPAGSGDIAKLRASIAQHLPEIIAKQVELAKAGDAQAARLLLERVLPPLKASEQTAPMAMPTGTLTEQGRAVLAAIAAGELAPGQGAALLSSLGTLADLTKADELERRIQAMEATQKQWKENQ